MSWPLACKVNARCGPVICAGGQVDVPDFSAASTSLMPTCAGGQRVRVHLHVHGVLLRAQHLHLRDAR